MAFAAALLASGCTREHEQEPAREEGITVKLFVDGMATKGEDDILSGFLYLFDDVNAAPFKTVAISGTTTVLDFADFGSAEKVKRTTVFAVTGGSELTPSSLKNLKDMPIETPLFLDGSGKKVKADPDFYMTAEGKFEKVDDNTTTCNLTLKRLAAKLTLEVAYKDPITTPGTWKFKEGEEYTSTTTWTPMTSGQNTRVYLENAVSNTVIGAASTPVAKPGTYTMFKYDPAYMGGAAKSAPFYSYPVSWTAGTESEPFIKLIQPWRYTTTVVKDEKKVVVDENVVELYYKVMVPTTLTALEANTWYQPKVTLNILGGEADRPTVIGADGLTVMDWKGVTSEMPAVSINPADFLVPEKESFEVSNGNSLQIKYFASGPVTVTVKDIYKTVYSNTSEDTKYIFSTTESYPSSGVKDIYDKEFDDENDDDGHYSPWFTNTYDTSTKSGIITLNHTLSSNFKLKNFSARPYIYKLTLSLDGTTITQDISIVQNPPVMVKGIESTGYVSVNGYTTNFGDIARKRKSTEGLSYEFAYTTVSYSYSGGSARNLINTDAGAYNELGRVHAYRYLAKDTGNNACEYMFKVQVSPLQNKYVGDPRIGISENSESDDELFELLNLHRHRSNYNLTGSPLFQFSGSETTDMKNLRENYKPTKRTGADDIIAPEFIVASSFGKSSTMSYYEGLVRCEAYQEDGYPAGRWRLPTKAEIEYCVRLQEGGYIPELFTISDGSGYASSSKSVFKDGGFEEKEDTYTRAVRCVYDSWYWGSEPVLSSGTYTEGGVDYVTYTWGGYSHLTK